MPIYEYGCEACGEEHEIIQKMGAGALRKCPSCGALRLRRKISRSAFYLKGAGWYVTDYASNGESKEKETASEGAASESKPEAKSADKADGKKAAAANGASSSSETGKKESGAVAAG